jgi:hypothetical protein
LQQQLLLHRVPHLTCRALQRRHNACCSIKSVVAPQQPRALITKELPHPDSIDWRGHGQMNPTSQLVSTLCPLPWAPVPCTLHPVACCPAAACARLHQNRAPCPEMRNITPPSVCMVRASASADQIPVPRSTTRATPHIVRPSHLPPLVCRCRRSGPSWRRWAARCWAMPCTPRC